MQFTFYKNDGTSTYSTLTTDATSITAPSITDVGDSHADWTRTGFNFVEWNSNSTGSGTSYSPNDTVSLKDISYLYAIWEENHEITVTYKGATVTSLDTSGNITLGTAGKYCEGNILIEYDRPSAPSPVLQSKSATYTPTTSSQSETITADSGYDGLSSVAVTVDAMPTGTAGTPIAAKGTVSNHAISVTPSVTNITGYILGGTKTGSAVSVSASELVSGTLTISSSGTKDVTNYASASVASGSASTPATTITTNPSISVNASGLITASVSGSKSVTPTVSAGYVTSGTAGTVTVSGSNTSQLSTQAAATITPTESEQTAVAAGKYTTGIIKVGAISSSYVGSGIDRRDETDLSISGATVTVPAGYYEEQETTTVPSGTEGTPVATKTTSSTTTNYLPPMVDGTYSGNGVTAVVSNGVATFSGTTNATGNAFIIPLQSSMIIPDDSYLHCMNSVLNASLTPSFELSSDVSNTYFAPSLSPANRIYTIPTNRYGVTIDRIRFYISNGVTISGTFSPMICLTSSAIPYEPYGATNTILVTPSVTNTAGYIVGGTKTGEAVTVTASELVYGTKEITSAGTTDVTNYASASVASGVEGTPVATKSIISASKNLSPVSSLAAMDLWGSDLNTALRMGATLKTLPTGVYTISWKYTLTALDSGTFQYGSYIRWYDGSNWHILASYSLTTASNPSIGDKFNVARTIIIDDDAYGKDINVLAYCGQGGGSAWRASVDEYQIEAGSQQTAFEPYQLSNAMSVTPSVTNESGYINGSTIVGDSVTVFASELVSGDLAISASGTTDVTNYATATVASGTAGTPTATKGTVSNHAVSVTPSVTNTAGYITGGTKTGTAVTVSASELVSGTYNVTSSGTKDVTNYASVSIPSGSASTPTTTIYPTITTGVSPDGEVMIDVSKTQSITPSVVAGYVSSGTSGNVRVSGYTTLQLDVYDGEHHQPPVLTVSLTNPVNSSYFDICEIYDESSGSTKIGEITSADGSVSIILDQDHIDEFYGSLNITIQLTCKTGGHIYLSTQNILCTGNVVYDWYNYGSIGVLVSGSGTVTLDSVDYNL